MKTRSHGRGGGVGEPLRAVTSSRHAKSQTRGHGPRRRRQGPERRDARDKKGLGEGREADTAAEPPGRPAPAAARPPPAGLRGGRAGGGHDAAVHTARSARHSHGERTNDEHPSEGTVENLHGRARSDPSRPPRHTGTRPEALRALRHRLPSRPVGGVARGARGGQAGPERRDRNRDQRPRALLIGAASLPRCIKTTQS